MAMQLIQTKHVKALNRFGFCCYCLAVTKELPARKIVAGATLTFQYYNLETQVAEYYDLRILSVQEAELDPKMRDVVLAPALERHHIPAPG